MEIKVNNENNDIRILEPKVIFPQNLSQKSKHIVLIHGFAIDQRCWELFVEKEKNNYIHLLNLPGHGNLKYKIKDLEFDSMVSYIKQYIESLNTNNIILIGHSFGAAIAFVVNDILLKENKKIIEKLIVMAPYSKYSIPKVYNKIPLFKVKNEIDFLHLQQIVFENPTNTLDRLKKYFYEEEMIDFFKRNWKYLKYIIFQMSKFTTFSKINVAMNNIQKNTYLLLGEFDQLVPNMLVIDKIHEIDKSIYVSIYKNCGHGFFVEQDLTFHSEIERIINDEI